MRENSIGKIEDQIWFPAEGNITSGVNIYMYKTAISLLQEAAEPILESDENRLSDSQMKVEPLQVYQL